MDGEWPHRVPPSPSGSWGKAELLVTLNGHQQPLTTIQTKKEFESWLTPI